jgi:hypothetical protein
MHSAFWALGMHGASGATGYYFFACYVCKKGRLVSIGQGGFCV